MTKDIIETEIERLFPQFNHAEIVAAVMAAEWMQDYQKCKDIEETYKWLYDNPVGENECRWDYCDRFKKSMEE